MTGTFTGGRPVLPITLRLQGQPVLSIEYVVDTGFSEFLSLPERAVALMGLTYLHDGFSQLADGSKLRHAIYRATVIWDGVERVVSVLATGERPLVGRAMMADHELIVQFREGGLVTVEPL